MTVESLLDDLIEREGGYVDHPADTAGATKYGITQQTLEQWRGHFVSTNDLRALTVDEARQIYLARYLKDPGLDRIQDERLQELVFDAGVNHGPKRAVRWLQEVVGVTADGIMGPKTAAAVNGADPGVVYRKFLARRIVFYGEIVNRNRSQAAFIEGWLRRMAPFVENA
jgi:lysozyme family protein